MNDIEKMTIEINAKVVSIILFWTYFFIGLATEGFILWLFPDTGLPGLICWPTAIFLSLVFAFLILRIHKKTNKIRLTLISFISILTIQGFMQLIFTPQEGEDPIEQISEAIATYNRFDKIDFDNFPKLKQFERVSYLFAKRNTLPDSYLILSIDSVNDEHLLPGHSNYYTRSKSYIIEKRNKKKTWNTRELGIVENDSSTVIIERFPNGDSLVYKTMENFIRGGVGDFRNYPLSLSIIEDDLELKTGIQKVFYNLLKLGNKNNR